ncbi:MAG: PQQ-like beta-propeller repeat protein [Acidobacteriota bacterium]|jgi:outer membrane protein assembly factor BamB
MTDPMIDAARGRKPIRLWPGVGAAALLLLFWFVLPWLDPELGAVGAFGSVGCALLVVVWWVFFSRVPWLERGGAILLAVVAIAVTPRLLHESVAGAGMGMTYYFYAIPSVTVALVLWAVASRHLPAGLRRPSLVTVLLVACCGWTLLRIDGVTFEGADWAWRWSPTAEERLLARAGEAPATPVKAPAELEGEAEWPGFRGPGRDSVVPGVRIDTDWAASPPRELWRRRIGPGWSSFAVQGDRIYTQEQRGEEEMVSCYAAMTGEPVWSHSDGVRFWEANAGAGPRGTPFLHGGRVYALGATGVLNALDAGDGSVVWSRDAAADTGAEVPYWGFAGSPLVVGDVVLVAASGTLAAYDVEAGELRWSGPKGGSAYSSPHPATLDGIPQVLLLDGEAVIGVDPADGAVLWDHAWPGAGILQPARTGDGDLLVGALGMTAGLGLRRLAVTQGPGGWTVEERWTSRGLKPYFNDFVVHEGHAYGFDGSILACIDLRDGARAWKGGRYGNGQLLLLPDQDALLVISEEGELALVGATPEGFVEHVRMQALQGKTWNHPALVDDVLFVRNGEEMAAFRLPVAPR